MNGRYRVVVHKLLESTLHANRQILPTIYATFSWTIGSMGRRAAARFQALTNRRAYLTYWLNIDEPGPPELHAGRRRRSHSAGNSRAFVQGRTVGHGTCAAVRHEPSGGLQTFEGPRTSGAHRTWPRRAVAPVPPGPRTPERGGSMARWLSPVLGRELRPSG